MFCIIAVVLVRGAHAVPLYDHSGKTPAELFIEDSISACNEIRKAGPKGYEQTLLPNKFEEYLRESLKKAKAVLTEGGNAIMAVSEPLKASREILVPRKIMLSEAHALERDVEDLIRNHKLTLEQWNLFHLRLVVLFEESFERKGSSPSYFNCFGLEHAVSSQEALSDFLLHRPACVFMSGYFKPFDSCAISAFYDLGVKELNLAFVQGVYPLGISPEYTHADGKLYSPSEFMNHDFGHIYTDVGHTASAPPPVEYQARLERKRKWGKEFIVNRLPNYSPADQVKLGFVYFLLHHENLQAFKDLATKKVRNGVEIEAFPGGFNVVETKEEWMTSGFCKDTYDSYTSTMGSRISNCHDLGSLIPQEVTQLIAGVPLPIFEDLLLMDSDLFRTFNAPDPINQFYYESARLFCQEWAKLRWPDPVDLHK